jgi:hypothetical protein
LDKLRINKRIMRKLILILAISLFTGVLMGQQTFRTNVVILKTTPMLHLYGTGGYINFNNGDVLLTHGTNLLTLSGGNFNVGSNSILGTGSIGATGVGKFLKGWFTDIEITNSPTINGVSIASIYAPIASPTFTGTVSGISATMVGLGNVTNASKATMFTDPTFTGTTRIIGLKVGATDATSHAVLLDSITSTGANILFYHGTTALNGGGGGGGTWGSITGTIGTQSDLQSALALKADLASPTFTGTVSGVSKAMVGLSNVTNESKATMFASPTFTGTVSGITAPMIGLGNVTNESKATMFTNAAFTGTTTGVTKAMVGLSNATNESKATMFTSPTFTGTVSGVTAAHVGLGSVTNESKATMFASPTFTTAVTLPTTITIGVTPITTTAELNFVHGVTSNIQAQFNDTVALSNVVVAKADSVGGATGTYATGHALSLKANIAAPIFTGTVKISTDTVATRAYARQYGGSGTLTAADTLKLSARIDLKQNSLITVNAQSASYTLVITDANKVVTVSNASANNLTVPPNASVAFSIGTQLTIVSIGTGQTNIVAGSGVTINSAGGALKLRVQYSSATLIKTATNTWLLIGDISI